jgi:SAM-dependent methyltransferase
VSHVSAASFEARYRAHPDPWAFATSFFEIRRYEVTMACLPRPRFRRAFEPACANGELTWRLASRCERVEALDCSATAVARARVRCAGLAGISFEVGELPADWPGGRFDLIVLSELGYYFDRRELARLREMAVGALVPAGVLIGVHWLGVSEDHLLGGDNVHRVLDDGPGLAAIGGYRDERFRLDIWERR